MKSPMKAPLETQTKSHQSKTKAKEKLIKLGKANDIKHGQSIQRQNTELHTASTSKVQSKDKNAFHTKVSEADTVERKVMFATSNPSKKDIKVVNSASTTTKEDASNFDHKLGTVNTTKLMDEKTVSVMTLAGENRGATMHVADSNTQSTRKKGSIPKQGEGEGEENRSTEKAYVNSNIQNMNNSFMLHGSINGRDPGVRVILPQQPQRDDERGLENPKAKSEVKINRAERVAYQPVVRRRCLRGLFMEPSDSDPDNPNKPRRHGCKFSCGEVRKDNDTGIV
ncbi:hypothetical protein SESBI_42103 [Sesbania bispinosa]|nr:hypothetical protein SESBI_42103 [Sesbania bispinosa]